MCRIKPSGLLDMLFEAFLVLWLVANERQWLFIWTAK
jgi:hypothetical protein